MKSTLALISTAVYSGGDFEDPVFAILGIHRPLVGPQAFPDTGSPHHDQNSCQYEPEHHLQSYLKQKFILPSYSVRQCSRTLWENIRKKPAVRRYCRFSEQSGSLLEDVEVS